MVFKVIDVSRYQGNIKFSKVSTSNVDGVILRSGIGNYTDGAVQEDSKFKQNLLGFELVEMPLGGYYFSQATTEAEAIIEAKFVLTQWKGHKVTLPLAYDFENEGRIKHISKEQATKNIIAFCTTIKNAGYPTCLYTYLSLLQNKVVEQDIRDAGIDIWLAHYTTASHPEYQQKYCMWQYSSSGSVEGISGNVDMNYCYKNYFEDGGRVMTFIPRTTAPLTTDKNWISTKYGGNNHALVINKSTGSVLPNCTGYVHGRAIELGYDESKLCTYNADQYFNYTYDGYARGKTPKLGAIMCWSCPGKAGHVAIVEKIHGERDVTASQSNYSGTRFYTRRFNPYSWPSGYTFQGYIYCPIDYDGTGTGIGTPVARDKTRTQVQVIYDAIRARTAPYLGDNVLGFVSTGVFNVLQEKDMTHEPSNGYVWYEIEENVWVANVGSDNIVYLPPTEKPKDYTALVKIGFASSGDIKQIKALLDELQIGYTTPETGYVITKVAPSKGDRDKIDALCNEKGIPCVEYSSTGEVTIEELTQQIAFLNKSIDEQAKQIKVLSTQVTELTEDNQKLTDDVKTLSKDNSMYIDVFEQINLALESIN